MEDKKLTRGEQLRKALVYDKKNGYENKSDDVCKKSNCPVAVLVLGNWNNETDQANFQDPAFQQKMMEGIYIGILTYWDIPVQG